MNSLYIAAILVTSFLPGADTVPIRTIKSGAWSDPTTWESKKSPRQATKLLSEPGIRFFMMLLPLK